jgi:hypothetical protein
LPDANKNSEKKTMKQNQVNCIAVTRKMKHKLWENIKSGNVKSWKIIFFLWTFGWDHTEVHKIQAKEKCGNIKSGVYCSWSQQAKSLLSVKTPLYE